MVLNQKWFTADTHFNHTNILEMESRPWDNITDMNLEIIEKWNEVVRPGDVVYHLGDFAFPQNILGDEGHDIEYLITQLHGSKFLIVGNHDRKNWNKFGEIYKRMFVKVEDIMYIKHHKQKIFLSHYSHRVWRASIHGSWHLYGHSHGNLSDHGKSFDVGVDVWNYYPINFEQVQEKMLTLDEHDLEEHRRARIGVNFDRSYND